MYYIMEEKCVVFLYVVVYILDSIILYLVIHTLFCWYTIQHPPRFRSLFVSFKYIYMEYGYRLAYYYCPVIQKKKRNKKKAWEQNITKNAYFIL